MKNVIESSEDEGHIKGNLMVGIYFNITRKKTSSDPVRSNKFVQEGNLFEWLPLFFT